MPCPHNEITIVQRSQRQSAVAAAAYQSGEKLFCEYDQQVKHYQEKRGIVHNEILLPANAPQEYADRNTLWNAAEAVEKQWNSQLARRWVLTIPREIPPDQYAVLVREFCQKQFVSKGMIADFAIHDPHPPGHNPHAHVLLTMRAMDEHGKWLPKSRKVYDLDENGERIKLPSGRWKSHKEDTVDWNDQKYCEIWRHEWEVIQNRYLEANDRPERVDLRSYARQGLDIVPIQMITEKNNMHDFDTSMFFRWIFKSAFAILIVSNTWNIVMGVFDATQSVVNQSSGVIIGETSIHFDRLIPGLEFQLESMTIGSLLSLWFQTLVVGLTMNILSICIFLVTYGRMIEIYVVTALGPIPLATMGSSEWRSTGQNYLKSLLALGFQAFLIMIVVGIYAVLIRNISGAADIAGAIWGCMGYTVLLCFCLFKTGSISKSVFGAH